MSPVKCPDFNRRAKTGVMESLSMLCDFAWKMRCSMMPGVVAAGVIFSRAKTIRLKYSVETDAARVIICEGTLEIFFKPRNRRVGKDMRPVREETRCGGMRLHENSKPLMIDEQGYEVGKRSEEKGQFLRSCVLFVQHFWD
jgi:hypothetical protein